MMDDGYIKYKCTWIRADAIPFSQFEEINKWRDKLYGLGLVGAYENGVGFGNASVRCGAGEFIITGTATGNISKLEARHYTKVVGFDVERNALTCEGPIKASSEALSHAAVYLSDAGVNAVFHVHNLSLWERLRGKLPTTSSGAAYGTPEVAREIMRLFVETDVRRKKTIVMGGHREGLIFFGESPDDAGEALLRWF